MLGETMSCLFLLTSVLQSACVHTMDFVPGHKQINWIKVQFIFCLYLTAVSDNVAYALGIDFGKMHEYLSFKFKQYSNSGVCNRAALSGQMHRIRLVHGSQLHVSSSAGETTRWPPTEDWQYSSKTVMLACGAAESGCSEYQVRVNWCGYQGKKTTNYLSLNILLGFSTAGTLYLKSRPFRGPQNFNFQATGYTPLF